MWSKSLKKSYLICLRGKLSQAQLAQKMGLNKFQVYRWENSLVTLKWPDFVDLAQASGINLELQLNKSVFYRGDPKDASELCRYLVGGLKQKEVGELLGVPLHRVKKLFTGRALPSLEEMAELFKLKDGSYSKFFSSIVDYSSIPEISEALGDPRLDAAHFFVQHPLASFLLIWLFEGKNQSIYKNDLIRELVKHTETSKEYLDDLINHLAAMNLLSLSRGKIKVEVNPYERKMAYKEGTQAIYYWLDQINKMNPKKFDDFDPWEYIYINVDQKGLEQIKKIGDQYLNDVLAVAQKYPSGDLKEFRFVFTGQYNVLPNKV